MADEKPQDGTETTAQVAESPEPQDGAGDAKLQELVTQKRRANAEAQAAKKHAAELQAQLDALKDKEKSDLQRATEAADKLAKDLASTRAEKARTDRVNQALRAGATDPDYIAWKLEQAGDKDPAEVLEELKKGSPHLFGVSAKAPPPASGQGGPSPASGKSAVTDLQEIEQRLIALESKGRAMSEKEMAEAMGLRRARRHLLAQVTH